MLALDLFDCFVKGGGQDVGQGLNIVGIDDLGIDGQRLDLLLTRDGQRNRAAARLNLIFLGVQLLLSRRHILLHLLSLADHALHILRTSADPLGQICFHISYPFR